MTNIVNVRPTIDQYKANGWVIMDASVWDWSNTASNTAMIDSMKNFLSANIKKAGLENCAVEYSNEIR